MALLGSKVAVVLGAGTRGNMGQAIAAQLAAEGARVIVAGRNRAEVQSCAATLGGLAAVCDITNEDDLAALMELGTREFGGFDIAVNATGLNQVKPVLDVRREELQRIIDVQFTGTYLFLQAVLRAIRDGGSIIQISSVSANALLPNHAAYMATKAAGDVLVRALASEFGERGIRINSIAPGPTSDTPMATAALADPERRARVIAAIPLRRMGTALDIARAAVWLASDECFITGEVLQVNGGRAIHQLG